MKTSKALRRIISLRNAKRLPEHLADIARLTIDEILERGISIGDARQISAAIALAKEIAEPSQDYTRERIVSPATVSAAIRPNGDFAEQLKRNAEN